MGNEIQVRTVTAELLRAGPAHNQLLSPLTQYLGICDDGEAAIVTQPYEQAVFMERIKAMQYGDGSEEGARRTALRELGIEAARVLGAIPRLAGSLTADPAGPDTIVHLKLVLTPSELAALPFELAKVPIGPNSLTEAWLSLQANVPVVITRRTRNGPGMTTNWPLEPRVLFISADPEEVPFAEHRQELIQALEPLRRPDRDEPTTSADGRHEKFGSLLTILKNAAFEDVVAECAANRYTHIHILAHGSEDPDGGHKTFGLTLANELISAERLASAFNGVIGRAIHRPTVVTLATCDSGNVGSVMVPGGSIAHVLHQAGIPLVLASQVPLTKEGSVLVVRELYRGLLRCENPWVLMHGVRKTLHGRLGARCHDWASLVVYESLPAQWSEFIEQARYQFAKMATDAAFARVDRAVAESGNYDGLSQQLEQSLEWLPDSGRFRLECLGLRASSFKRRAQVEVDIAGRDRGGAKVGHAIQSVLYLQRALHFYEQATRGFLTSSETSAQRNAALHWVLTQQLSLLAVLGKDAPEGAAEMARMSAHACIEHQALDERAWAHGSLAELDLLSLDRSWPGEAGRSPFDTAREGARRHVREVIRLAHLLDQPFLIESTLRQFRRYVDWWGTKWLQDAVSSMSPDDSGARGAGPEAAADQSALRWQQTGLLELARELIALLDRRGAAERAEKDAKQRSPDAKPSGHTASHPAPAPQAPAPVPAEKPGHPAGMLAAPAQHAPPQHTGASGQAFVNIEMLPGGHGDCLWIEYGGGGAGKTSRVLIDCGTPHTFVPHLKPRLERQPADARHFELFVMSHIDSDHIGGAIPFMEAVGDLGVTVGDVWFNGWKHISKYGELGAKQGEMFSALVERNYWPWNIWRDGAAIVLDGPELPTCTLPGGMVLTLLSPTVDKLKDLAVKWKKEITALGAEPGQGERFLARTTVSTSTDVPALAAARFKPDAAANNGSSIGLLAEYGGKSVLLGADCHAPLLAASIKNLLRQRGQTKLKLDAFKIPHHGSQNNLNQELVELVDCDTYLISTNGDVFQHPDREAVARCIHFGGPSPRLIFNYSSKTNDVWARGDLRTQYGYSAVYPDADHAGVTVKL